MTTPYGDAVSSGNLTVDYRLTIDLGLSTHPDPLMRYGPDFSAQLVRVPLITRQRITSQPAATRSSPGFSAWFARFALAGPLTPPAGGVVDDTRDVRWLLSSLSGTSPLYGRAVGGAEVRVYEVVTVADGSTVQLTRFTGQVDEVSCDPRSGQVTITALDGRAKARSNVYLPPVVGVFATDDAGVTTGPGLSAFWCLDYLARASGFHVAPPPPVPLYYPVPLLGFISHHGSLWPEVGLSRFPKRQLFVAAPAVAQDNVGKWARQLIVPAGGAQTIHLPTGTYLDGFYSEVWVRRTGTLADGVVTGVQQLFSPAGDVVGGYYTAIVRRLSTGRYRLTVVYQSTTTGSSSQTFSTSTAAAVADTAWIRVGLAWETNGATHTARLYVNGTRVASTSLTEALPGPSGAPYGVRVYEPDAGMLAENWWLDLRSAVPPDGDWPDALTYYAEGFVPSADLDPTSGPLGACPDVDPEADAWQVMQQIADAELAVVSFTADRVLTSRARSASSAPVRVLSTLDSAAAFTDRVSLASIRNDVSGTLRTVGWAGYAALAVAFNGYLPPVPGRRTVTFEVELSGPFTELSGDWSLRGPSRSGSAVLDIRAYGGRDPSSTVPPMQAVASSRPDGLTETPADGYVVTADLISPTRARVTVQNNGTSPLYFVFPEGAYGFADDDLGASYTTAQPYSTGVAGRPGLFLLGTPQVITDEKLEVAWQPSIDAYELQPLALSGNPFRQDREALYDLLVDLLGDYASPRPELSDVQIVADGRLDPGVRVQLQDPDRGIDETVVIDAVTDQARGVATISARMTSRPGGWVLGVAGRSELGVSTRV